MHRKEFCLALVIYQESCLKYAYLNFVSKQNFTWVDISVFPQLQLNLLRDPAQFQNGRACVVLQTHKHLDPHAHSFTRTR
jgi:hypothetical protein